MAGIPEASLTLNSVPVNPSDTENSWPTVPSKLIGPSSSVLIKRGVLLKPLNLMLGKAAVPVDVVINISLSEFAIFLLFLLYYTPYLILCA
jgi:hypothetical protein